MSYLKSNFNWILVINEELKRCKGTLMQATNQSMIAQSALICILKGSYLSGLLGVFALTFNNKVLK